MRAAESDSTPVLSAERLSGNPHSGGYDSLQTAKRLHRLFPQAKVLVVVREQTEEILSCYNQYVRAGGVLPYRFAPTWIRLTTSGSPHSASITSCTTG